MTRKDYVILAKALRNARPATFSDGAKSHEYTVWLAAACSVADALMADNNRFDSDRFLNACEATS